MRMIIDDNEIEVFPGETILEAARRAGVQIPTLCHHPAFEGQGRCRMCLVEVTRQGMKRTVASCTYPVMQEIEVKTSTPEIESIRRNIVMLLYKQAPESKLMKELFRRYGCSDNSLRENKGERCILCNLCVKACEKMGTGAIAQIMRGTEKRLGTPYDQGSPDCIGCGACAVICPTGAIEVQETEGKRSIWHKDFPLVACTRCGCLFAAQEQVDFFAKQGVHIGEPVGYCPGCRKKVTAIKIAEFRHSSERG